MSIEWFRDLIICIYGVLGIIVLIFLVILFLIIYKKIKLALNSIEATADNINQVVDTIKVEFVEPLVHIMAVVQGIKQGLNLFSKLFKKE